jgi:hypothetical protein
MPVRPGSLGGEKSPAAAGPLFAGVRKHGKAIAGLIADGKLARLPVAVRWRPSSSRGKAKSVQSAQKWCSQDKGR